MSDNNTDGYTPNPGWYPDPAAPNQVRYWDGTDWTGAAVRERDWPQRHPALTAVLAFWAACVMWQWQWMAPLLILTVAAVLTLRWDRARRRRLATDAERQNKLALNGDPRGIYGNYPPTAGRTR